MHQIIAEIVTAIEPFDALEGTHLQQSIAWINAGAPLFRTQKPATPPQHLVAYLVVVDLARRKLLLTDHKDAGLWLPNGGHVESNEHPRDAAAREATEELGIVANFVWPDPLFLTVTKTQGLSAGHTDVSLWYLLHGDATVALHPDPDEFHRVAWFAFDQLPLARTDPHLARFVAKLQLRMAQGQP